VKRCLRPPLTTGRDGERNLGRLFGSPTDSKRRGLIRCVVRLLQNTHEFTVWRRRRVFISYILLGFDGVAIDLFICVVARTKRGAFDGDSGKMRGIVLVSFFLSYETLPG
jgi:hypothetical protein